MLVDDGHGDDDLLHLVVEIKGYRREDAKEKKSTMDTYWVPGGEQLGHVGRWAFAEFTEVYQIEADFEAKVRKRVQQDDRQRRRRPQADDRRPGIEPHGEGPEGGRLLPQVGRSRSSTRKPSGRTSPRRNTSPSSEGSAATPSASPTSGATETLTRSSSGAARTSRTGATSSSMRRRSTFRRRSTLRR